MDTFVPINLNLFESNFPKFAAGKFILTKNLRYAKKFIINILEKETKAMKHAAAKSTVDMLHKIEAIEKEVMDLKLSVLSKLAPSGKKVISLKGILKGVEITEQDISNAKKSLYSKVGL